MFHMEQNNYKLRIVNELVKEKQHVRALAKKLKTNHTTILRKLRELSNENVLDFKEQGKNKIYFLKNTSEVKSYIFMAENYKLNQLLKKYPNLRKIVESIQRNKKIKLAIIFGSYAKGLAKKISDIDIYIETINKEIKKELEIVNSRANIKMGKYDSANLLIKEIEKNHVIIKGVEIFYEKYKFFE
jgi:predicted nucleotidyltransferase